MRILIFAISCLILCTSCAYIDGTAGEYRRNKAKWQSAGISKYSLVESMSCECIANQVYLKVNVSNNGNKESYFYSDVPAFGAKWSGGKPNKLLFSAGSKLPEEYLYSALTVDELFVKIGEAISSNARSIEVEYSSEYGYPKSISIDYSRFIHDEEFIFGVHSFEK